MAFKVALTIHDLNTPLPTVQPMVDWAAGQGMHLDVVVLGVLPPLPVMAPDGVPDPHWRDDYDATLADAESRRGQVQEMVQKAGLSAGVVTECVDAGNIDRTIARHALYTDVTLLAADTILKSDVATRSFNGAIFDTGRPALTLAKNGIMPTPLKRVLIAWNGEREASEALHHSLPLLGDADDVRIVIIDPKKDRHGPNPGDDIAAYLVKHDVPVTVDRVAGSGRNTADVLLERASDMQADLIVMGAYGRSRLMEWMLGGTTREMIEKSGTPLLMAH